MKGWQPDVDLRRLLEALGEEIAAAADEDVRQVYRETGRSMSGAAREVRHIIAALNDSQDEPDPGVPLGEAARRREPCVRPH